MAPYMDIRIKGLRGSMGHRHFHGENQKGLTELVLTRKHQESCRIMLNVLPQGFQAKQRAQYKASQYTEKSHCCKT